MSVNIGSSGQWNTLLSGTEVVVADFYADWCGPCKMIGPHFEKLAAEHSRPKKIAFAKINTDNQNDLSRQYGVSSMPTFKVFHKGACIETIKGANPAALAAAVTKAKQLCSAGGGGGAAFETKGRKLGGESRALNIKFNPMAFLNAVVTFLGLYVMSFFSLNAYQAAQKSMFNPEAQRHFRAQKSYESGARATKPPPRPAGFKTLADIGSS